MDTADDDSYDLWADGLDIIDQIRHRDQLFKQPKVLRYVAALQSHLQQSGVVGKSNSITDVVKKVYQELFEADAAYYRVPDTSNAVAQTLISFQNSHKPDDLWHLITPDYKKANIWVQLKNGDNKDMEEVIMAVDRFMADNPPPVPMKHQWAGLTYLNVMWQNKMVSGMLKSFLSSFAVVFVMMALLFRSPLWGLLAMVPLSVTIATIYGIIGLAGKDYDMPVAILSSLTLGLAVDFAIHFLERSRMAFKRAGSWKEGIKEMFEEPARAISRNVIVIAVGFTPLLAAPLVPYRTVGIFLASIMAISGIATMLILPALVKILEKWLFKFIEE
jgi:predicted RND superfamily exporter protein